MQTHAPRRRQRRPLRSHAAWIAAATVAAAALAFACVAREVSRSHPPLRVHAYLPQLGAQKTSPAVSRVPPRMRRTGMRRTAVTALRRWRQARQTRLHLPPPPPQELPPQYYLYETQLQAGPSVSQPAQPAIAGSPPSWRVRHCGQCRPASHGGGAGVAVAGVMCSQQWAGPRQVTVAGGQGALAPPLQRPVASDRVSGR